MRDSIRKLRELRESLCSKQSEWQEAFAARDRVVEDLRQLYLICTDKRSRKKTIEKKILEMFEYLHVDPQCIDEEKV